MDNPYESHDVRSLDSGVTSSRRIIWIQCSLILIVGIPLSSLGVWLHASSEPGFYGGQPVSMSTFGHGFFMTMGGTLGLASGLIIGAIYLERRNRASANSWRTWTVPVGAGFLVCIIAFLAYFLLMMTVFFSMPDDLYRMIFNVPTQRL